MAQIVDDRAAGGHWQRQHVAAVPLVTDAHICAEKLQKWYKTVDEGRDNCYETWYNLRSRSAPEKTHR